MRLRTYLLICLCLSRIVCSCFVPSPDNHWKHAVVLSPLYDRPCEPERQPKCLCDDISSSIKGISSDQLHSQKIVNRTSKRIKRRRRLLEFEHFIYIEPEMRPIKFDFDVIDPEPAGFDYDFPVTPIKLGTERKSRIGTVTQC